MLSKAARENLRFLVKHREINPEVWPRSHVSIPAKGVVGDPNDSKNIPWLGMSREDILSGYVELFVAGLISFDPETDIRIGSASFDKVLDITESGLEMAAFLAAGNPADKLGQISQNVLVALGEMDEKFPEKSPFCPLQVTYRLTGDRDKKDGNSVRGALKRLVGKDLVRKVGESPSGPTSQWIPIRYELTPTGRKAYLWLSGDIPIFCQVSEPIGGSELEW